MYIYDVLLVLNVSNFITRSQFLPWLCFVTEQNTFGRFFVFIRDLRRVISNIFDDPQLHFSLDVSADTRLWLYIYYIFLLILDVSFYDIYCISSEFFCSIKYKKTDNVRITQHWCAFTSHCCHEKAIRISYWYVCACVLACVRACILPGFMTVAPQSPPNFRHYLINGEILGKALLNVKCVFWFYLPLCIKDLLF